MNDLAPLMENISLILLLPFLNRPLKESQRSDRATTLPHGCLSSLLQQKKLVSEWILQKFTRDHIYSSKLFFFLSNDQSNSMSPTLSWLIMFCFRQNKTLVRRLSKPNRNSKDLSFPTKYSQSFLSQLLDCLWKQNLSYWRNPQYTAVRFFYTVIISLMFGTICWKFGSKRSISAVSLIFFFNSLL